MNKIWVKKLFIMSMQVSRKPLKTWDLTWAKKLHCFYCFKQTKDLQRNQFSKQDYKPYASSFSFLYYLNMRNAIHIFQKAKQLWQWLPTEKHHLKTMKTSGKNSTYIFSNIIFMHAKRTLSQNTALQVETAKTINLKNTRQVV